MFISPSRSFNNMDRKVVLESKTDLPLNRVRLTFADDPRHYHATLIIELVVTTDDIQAYFSVGESYQLQQIL
jgi:hypothetical protein